MTDNQLSMVRKAIDNDPVTMFHKLYKVRPLSWQADLLRAVFKERKEYVVCTGGYSIGKTWFEPRLAFLWWIRYQPETIIIITGPTYTHLRDKFWKEFRVLRDEVSFGGALYATSWKGDKESGNTDIKTLAPQSRKTSVEKKAFSAFGEHAAYVLSIGDDSQGIDDSVYDAMDNATSTGHCCQVWFANPIQATGALFALSNKVECEHITASCLDHPNIKRYLKGADPIIPSAISGKWVEKMLIQHCKPCSKGTNNAFMWKDVLYQPDNWFASNVLGLFPEGADDSLLTFPSIMEAVRHNILPGDPIVIGVDVASFGGDETVIMLRQGGRVTIEAAYIGEKNSWAGTLIEKIEQLLMKFPTSVVCIDAIGEGAAIAGLLKEKHGDRVIPIKNNKVSLSAEYDTIISHVAYYLRDKFERGELDIPEDQMLIEQLASIRKKQTVKGLLSLESKLSRKARLPSGLASPDRAEALFYCFCNEVMAPRQATMEILPPDEGVSAIIAEQSALKSRLGL